MAWKFNRGSARRKLLIWLALLCGCGQKTGTVEQLKPGVKRAKTLIRSGKLDEAEEICRGLLQQDKSLAGTWADLAYIQTLQGKFRAAEGSAQKAISVDPSLAAAHATLGLALFRGGKGEVRALEALKTAIRLNPRLAEAWTTMGVIHYAMDDLEIAQTKLEAAVGLAPRLPEAHFNLALVYEALARTRGGGGTRERKDALKSYGAFLALEAGPDEKRAMARRSVERLKAQIKRDER